MSDTVSSASNTVATQLTETLNNYMCMSYGIRMFCWLVLLCFLFYSMSGIFMKNKYHINYDDEYDNDIIYRQPIFIEKFDNDNLHSFESKKSYKFKRIQLTAPSNEFKNPENIYFGQVNIYVIPNQDVVTYKLQAFANLAVLDGNIYIDDPEKINQKYTIMLTDDKQKPFEMELIKDNDGLYKLNYETNDANEISNLLNYKTIHIHYYRDNKDKILLIGKI